MVEQVTKRHPIRGFIWGILFGLGLALIAIGQGYAALGTLPPFILVIVGIVVGTVWGLVAPAKKPKGEPPRQPVPVEKVEPSRFDDFTDPTPAGTPAPAAPIVIDAEPLASPEPVASPEPLASPEAPADAGADEFGQTPHDEPEPRPPDQP